MKRKGGGRVLKKRGEEKMGVKERRGGRVTERN